MFYQLYKQEVEARIAKRWQTLWVPRRGEQLKRVKEVVGQPQADSAGAQGVEGGRGVVWEHAVFHKGKAVGKGRPPYSPESCEAGICGGSAVGRGA